AKSGSNAIALGPAFMLQVIAQEERRRVRTDTLRVMAGFVVDRQQVISVRQDNRSATDHRSCFGSQLHRLRPGFGTVGGGARNNAGGGPGGAMAAYTEQPYHAVRRLPDDRVALGQFGSRLTRF